MFGESSAGRSGTDMIMTGIKHDHPNDDETTGSVRDADARNGEPDALEQEQAGSPREPEVGQDTPTGTDPDAKYEQPGFEDKSFGQAVDQDRELVEELDDALDADEASRRFDEESAGAPMRQRQGHPETDT